MQDNRRRIQDAYAARHPDRARQERELRLERRAMLADFKHKVHGTIETHAQAAKVRQGSLARLHTKGAISNEQLGAALEIAAVHQRIGADVTVKTMSLETRVDVSRMGDGAFYEKLSHVRREVAYSRWRSRLPGPAGPILDMIAGDVGVVEVGRRYGMDPRRAKRLLTAALDLWPGMMGVARDEVDEASLAAAQAGIL
jgi:hypothetical protein